MQKLLPNFLSQTSFFNVVKFSLGYFWSLVCKHLKIKFLREENQINNITKKHKSASQLKIGINSFKWTEKMHYRPIFK